MSFPLHLNTYLMGLRSFIVLLFQWGESDDFRRQILTSKVGPRIERVEKTKKLFTLGIVVHIRS